LAEVAAQDGEYLGQYVLGMLYQYGKGVPKDEVVAASWFLKVSSQVVTIADAGDATAQFIAGELYLYGLGVQQNRSVAYNYYNNAAEQGNPDAQNALGVMANGLPGMTWFDKAAEQGHPGAQFNLGELYSSHSALPNSEAQALSWYQKAATQGHVVAQRRIARFYGYGILGLPQDYKMAVTWYLKAAEQGDKESQEELGKIYEDGRDGVPKNHKTSIFWYCKAGAAQCQWEAEKVEKQKAAEKLRPRQALINKTKRTKQFKSYKEAREFFKDGFAGDEQWSFQTQQGDSFDRLIYVNPQYYKGKVVETLMLVQQVVNKKTFLLKPIIYDADTIKTYYGVLNPNFPGQSGFADNKSYAIIAEVVGTADYVDVRGFTRTVPKLFVYAISPYPFK